MKDLAGRYLLTNRAMQRFNGISPEQLQGRRDVEIFGDFVSEWHEYERTVLSSGQPVEAEVTLDRADGTYTYYVSRFPLRDEAGVIQAIGGVGTNVTELKHVEQALAQQLRFQAAVAHCAQSLLGASVAPDQRDVLLAAVLEQLRVSVAADHIGLYMSFLAPDGTPSFRPVVQMPDTTTLGPFTALSELRPEWLRRLQAGEPVVIPAGELYLAQSPSQAAVQRRNLGRLWLLPVSVSGRPWGGLVLGDSAGLRDNEAETTDLLGAVANMVGAFLSRLESAAAIELQSSYARVLAACSGALLTRLRSAESQSEAVAAALQQLYALGNSGRAAIYALSAERADSFSMVRVAEACGLGQYCDLRASQLPGSSFPPALIAALRAGNATHGPVATLLAGSPAYQELLREAGVRAALFLPLLIDGSLWGFMLRGSSDAQQQVLPDELQMLQTVAEMVAAFVQSRQLLHGLREREHFLERRESLLRTTSDALPSGFLYQMLQDGEGVYHGTTYISAGVQALLGRSPQSLQNAPGLFDELVLPEDLPVYQAAMGKAARALSMIDLELRALRRDGRVGWFQLRAVPQPIAGGLTLWNGVVLEITGRKEAELGQQHANAVLHRRVAELAALNQIAQALMSWIDLPAALLTVGALLLRLFGAERIALRLRDERGDSMSQISLIGADTVMADGPTVQLRDTPLARRVLAARHGMVLDGGLHDPVVIPSLAQGLAALGSSALVQPLLVRGTPIGLLVVRGDDQHSRFMPSDVELAQTIAGLLSSAIEQRRLFQRTMAEAAQEERRRLGRELHDSITQSLYSLGLLARAWGQMALTESPATIATWFVQVEEIALQSLKELRLLIYQLRSEELDSLGLVAMLRQRIEAVAQRSGVAVMLDAEGYRVPAAPDAEPQLFGIVQEALNNALRHAQASTLTVLLQSDQTQVSVQISDDGQGFDLGVTSRGMGLTTMRERAEALGGGLTVISAPGAGTRILVRVPNRNTAPPPAHAVRGAPQAAACPGAARAVIGWQLTVYDGACAWAPEPLGSRSRERVRTTANRATRVRFRVRAVRIRSRRSWSRRFAHSALSTQHSVLRCNCLRISADLAPHIPAACVRTSADVGALVTRYIELGNSVNQWLAAVWMQGNFMVMGNVLEQLRTMLTPVLADQMGAVLRLNQETVKHGAEVVLPMLIGALAQRSATASGALAVLELAVQASGALLTQPVSYIDAFKADASDSLLAAIFGEGRRAVFGSLQQATGIDLQPLTALLAPICVALLGKLVRAQQLGAAALADLLRREACGVARSGSPAAVLAIGALQAGDAQATLLAKKR